MVEKKNFQLELLRKKRIFINVMVYYWLITLNLKIFLLIFGELEKK